MIQKNNKLLTIFTPTYNRGKLLKRLYKSLCDQTSKDFVWMVIDDGSTDDTFQIIQSFQKQNLIDIQYIKKSNGGKYTAYNLACKTATTELILIAMDSDDLLKHDAVAKISTAWKNNKNTGIVGLVYLCEDIYGKYLLTEFNDILLTRNPSLQQATIKGWFKGEAEYIFKTEYVKNFLYPERVNERFFNELYSYIQMTGRMKWYKESIYIRLYQDNGITKSFLKTILKSPLNYADYSNMMSHYLPNFFQKTKYTLYYDTFSILGDKSKYTKDAANPTLSKLLSPISSLIANYLNKRSHQI